MTSDILIVGAGPVGLTTAIILARYGVSVDLIDQTLSSASYSKALSISAASLKAFHGLGLRQCFETAGKPVSDIEIFANGRRSARIENRFLPDPYKYYLSLPQPETERILRDEAARLDCHVTSGKRLTSLKQSTESVDVTITDVAKFETQNVTYKFVVGCDGAQSAVRQMLDISFDGFDYDDYFIMGDVVFEDLPSRDVSTYYVIDGGFLIFLPMNDGVFRLVISKPGRLPANRPIPSQTELQEHLDRFVSPRLKIEEVKWASSARFFNRLASANRLDRVFLAGDAYHLFSPIGGQGMNTGIQDAVNLAWKLAYAARGIAKDDLLDSYSRERFVAVEKVARVTQNYTEAILGRQEPDSIKDLYRPDMRNRSAFKRNLPFQFSGLLYDHSLEGDEKTGEHVPYAEFSTRFLGIKDTFEIPLVGKNILFVSPFSEWDISAYLAPFEHVVYTKHLSPRQDRSLLEKLSLMGPRVCLVRPDGYIGFHGQASDVFQYLSGLYEASHEIQRTSSNGFVSTG